MRKLKVLFNLFLKGLVFGLGLTLWIVFIYATYQSTSYTAGDNALTAQSDDVLTLAKWNELVSRTRWIFTDSGDKVGIGTDTPSVKLEVNGNIIAAEPSIASHVATKNYVDSQGGTVTLWQNDCERKGTGSSAAVSCPVGKYVAWYNSSSLTDYMIWCCTP